MDCRTGSGTRSFPEVDAVISGGIFKSTFPEEGAAGGAARRDPNTITIL